MRTILQSLVLIAAFAFVFLWQQTQLSQYTIQTLGFFVFLLLLVSARKGNRNFNPANFLDNNYLSVFTLNVIILLLIFATGSINSSLFFLLYFLGFGIAFVFEPETIFIFMLAAIILFMPDALRNDVTGNMVKLGSIVLITPLAFFFGKEYKRGEKQDKQIQKIKEDTSEKAENIAKDVEDVLKKENRTLSEEEVKKLNQILEETQSLQKKAKK